MFWIIGLALFPVALAVQAQTYGAASIPSASPSKTTWGQGQTASPFAPEVFRTQAGQLDVRFNVPAGHALYQQRLKLTASPGWRVNPTWPQAARDSHGEAAYAHPLDVSVPIEVTDPSLPFQVHLTYQGCEVDVLCYPPQTQTFTLPNRVPQPTLVILGASGCAPCRRLDSQLKAPQVQAALRGWTVIHLDAGADPQLRARYQVNTYPTLRVYRPDGAASSQVHVGDMTAAALVHWLEG